MEQVIWSLLIFTSLMGSIFAIDELGKNDNSLSYSTGELKNTKNWQPINNHYYDSPFESSQRSWYPHLNTPSYPFFKPMPWNQWIPQMNGGPQEHQNMQGQVVHGDHMEHQNWNPMFNTVPQMSQNSPFMSDYQGSSMDLRMHNIIPQMIPSGASQISNNYPPMYIPRMISRMPESYSSASHDYVSSASSESYPDRYSQIMHQNSPYPMVFSPMTNTIQENSHRVEEMSPYNPRGFVQGSPNWRKSYTFLPGGCYNRCRPSCGTNNGKPYGCNPSCLTSCNNVQPSCGYNSQIYYDGPTMFCGRKNSWQNNLSPPQEKRTLEEPKDTDKSSNE